MFIKTNFECSQKADKQTISVVVPVYNAEKYIDKCIRSIQHQTYKNWNLILVDDGSEDKSGQICDHFAQKDGRIIVIHQKNKGSVEARKAGALCGVAQNNPWIMFIDADDKIPQNAIEKLYSAAIKYNVDMAVGNVKKMYKGFSFRNTYVAPCFQIKEPRKYTHQEIIDDLYISFFGISDFPVSLYAKLYRTEQLTKAIDFPSVVKFMGDDLSVSIRVIPEVSSLVILPDTVYYYRIGGGTSKFLPYLMDDFISLYYYKKKFLLKYPVSKKADYLMDIELINMTKTYFLQCKQLGKLTENVFANEIRRVCIEDSVRKAAHRLKDAGESISTYAGYVYNIDIDSIIFEVQFVISVNWKRNLCKSFLMKL